MLLFLLALLVIAGFVGAAASRRGFSPWWTMLIAAGAAAIALTQRSAVATCDSRDSADVIFGYAAVFAIGLFTTAAVTALFDAVRFARSGQKGLAAARVVPILLGAGLAFGTLVLWFFTLLSCLS